MFTNFPKSAPGPWCQTHPSLDSPPTEVYVVATPQTGFKVVNSFSLRFQALKLAVPDGRWGAKLIDIYISCKGRRAWFNGRIIYYISINIASTWHYSCMCKVVFHSIFSTWHGPHLVMGKNLENKRLMPVRIINSANMNYSKNIVSVVDIFNDIGAMNNNFKEYF